MKRFLLIGMVFLCTFSTSFAQIPLATQGFESSDTWTYTNYPEFYTLNSQKNVFDLFTSFQNILPTSGSNFLFLRDLRNPYTPGIPDGTESDFYHYLTFSTITIPQPIPEDLKLSFKYYANGFESSDHLAYEIKFDDGDTWSSSWDTYVDTSNAFTAYLAKDTDESWVLKTIDIPDTVSHVRMRIGGYQNGQSDWAAFDEFSLYLDSEADFSPPTATDATILSDDQIVLSFDEPLQSASVTVEGYSLSSSVFNDDSTQLTLNLSSALVDGDVFTISVDNALDIAGNSGIGSFDNMVHNDHVGNLVITEVNYDDPGQYNNLSYFEIYNNGEASYPLGGLAFTDGIELIFPEASLAPGEYAVIAAPAYSFNDCAALTYGCGFQSYFGFAPDFEISSGYLSTSGENLFCVNTLGEEVINFTYDDGNGWPSIPNGAGYSISLCDPTLDMNDASNWSLSSSIQTAVNPADSVLSPIGLAGVTQYYADPGTSCPGEEAIYGCTDPLACNYDASSGANADDGSCVMPNDCGSCEDDLSCLVSVTVSVDMSIEGFDPTDGSTNDGLDGTTMAVSLDDGAWLAMSDEDADGVWTANFLVFPNSSHTFNFNDGAGNGYESGANLANCATGNYGNDRTFTVDSVDLVMPTVCWESCEACPDIVSGCMDSTASNYNFAATEDDGSCTYAAPMQNLFFSEYAEGSSNNKYLEIYNPSSEAVSLSDYAFPSASGGADGSYEYWNTFDDGAEVPANGVYIIAHPSADAIILAQAGMTHQYLSNGDDGYSLAYGTEGNYIILDMIGDFGPDPGSGWEVAGVSNGTKDHTLVRKCFIEQGNADWTASAGTSDEDSEWIVLVENDWSDLGMHTVECPEFILGCTDSTANNYNALATEDDGSCDYTVISYHSLTVSVDMSVEGFVAGDGSTWDGLDGSSMAIRLDGGTWVAMTDMGDNVWSHTFADLVAGDYTYNFNDGWYESGSFGDCVGGQYGNDRLATIVDMDVTIPTVCWESCEACPEVILGCTDSTANNYNALATEDDGSCDYTVISYHSLTVSVDMSVEGFVAGDGSTWDELDGSSMAIRLDGGTWVAMTDMGDNVWSHTFADLVAGDYTYNFNDGWYESGSFGDCVGGQYGNDRLATIVDVDVTIPTVCWESCEACPDVILGCTDSTAINYDAIATEDDGSCVFSFNTTDLLITEITDPQNSSDAGRYLELYNLGSEDIDLSIGYALVRWTNGNTDSQSPVSLTGTIPAGGFYVVCNSATKFLATYGVEASQDIGTGGAADSNGDDNIALLAPDGSIIDMFGVAGVDGTGTDHEFEDGRAERACGTSPSSTWDANDWDIDNDSGGGDGPQYAPEAFDPFDWTCLTTVISGCTDSTATNYNALATEDDGSCDYTVVISGCTDSTATNYDALATEDDGSCEYLSYSLTVSVDMSVEGFVAGDGSTWDGLDGSSMAIRLDGGTWVAMTDMGDNVWSHTFADLVAGDYTYNFNDGWYESGSFGDCVGGQYGNDRLATIVDMDVTIPTVCWESCEACPEVILGCTDSTATNYDALATEDDGSCEYLSYHSLTVSVDMSVEGFVAGDGSTWDELDGSSMAIRLDGGTWVAMTDMGDNVWSHTFADLVAGDYTYNFNDGWYESGSFGDCVGGQYGNDRLATIVDVDVTIPTVCWESCEACPDVILGCTDSTAINYDAIATEDDGSCVFSFNTTDLLITEITDPQNSSDAGRYLELYNLGSEDIDLSIGYALVRWTNGNTDSQSPVSLTGTIPAGGFYVVCNSATKFLATYGVEASQDIGTGGAADSNGDDNIALLAPDGSIIDMFGVAGVDGTGTDHEFEDGRAERACGTSPSSTWDANDWDIDNDSGGGDGPQYAPEAFDPFDWTCLTTVISGCTDSTATNYNALATEDDGSCDYTVVISGCTDSTATNYDALATEDDGSCEYLSYSLTVSVDMSVEGFVAGDGSTWDGLDGSSMAIRLDGGTWVAMTDMGDNVWSHTFADLVAGDYTYNFNDGWYESGSFGDCVGGQYGNDRLATIVDMDVTIPTVCWESCEACPEVILGCTDASADNFDPNANEDDGSCSYCSSFEAVLIGTSDASAAGASDGSVQATGDGGSNNYSISVEDADGVEQNPFALAAGDYFVVVTDEVSGCIDMEAFTISEPTVGEDPCDIVPTGLFVDDIIHNRVVFNWSAPSAAPSHYMIRYRAVGTSSWTVMTAGPVNSNEFTGTSRTRYFMEPGTTYEWNIRARVLNEDGSTNCQSSWSASSEYTTLDACANLENLSVSTEAVWATLSADAPAAEWGVWQSKGKMRVVGTNSFRYVNGDENGNISTLKGNFTASTDYEWHTKAWCTGNVDSEGNSDPMYHSGWGDFSSFTTEAPCDKMPTNLSTSANGAQTAITMSWDTPESGAPDHYFLELTNVTTGQVWAWNNISGSDNSKTKFGLTAGDYSWRIRGACGTNGTSWATIFSQPVTYTLGGARLENSSVANLDVYPNPSRDIFNVTFTSEEAQTMTVKVVNMIGEEIFIEELTEYVGQYTQLIDMNTQPKGVYFLEITTSTGGINKKIVLQ